MGIILVHYLLILYSHIIMKINPDFDYDSLNILQNNIDIETYKKILNYLDFYLYKYCWNRIVDKWKIIYFKMEKNKNFIKSEYSKMKYSYIHRLISQDELNNLLKDFIGGDVFKAIIVINTIEETC